MRNENSTNEKQNKAITDLREFLVTFGLSSAGIAIGHFLAAMLVAAMLGS